MLFREILEINYSLIINTAKTKKGRQQVEGLDRFERDILEYTLGHFPLIRWLTFAEIAKSHVLGRPIMLLILRIQGNVYVKLFIAFDTY